MIPIDLSQTRVLYALFKLRGAELRRLNQRYLTEDSLIRKMELLNRKSLLTDQRVLAIGDADFSALSIAIYGSPQEVVIADNDKRLSEVLFVANTEFNLPVRFVYHDMRLKIIEILKDQFSLVITEPPFSRAGVTTFISRAVQCLSSEVNNHLFVTIPNSGPIRRHFDELISKHNIQILEIWPEIIEYQSVDAKSDFVQLVTTSETTIAHEGNWIIPFYDYEENAKVHTYRCLCHRQIQVGEGQELKSLEELSKKGHSCGHKGVFAFKSDVELV